MKLDITNIQVLLSASFLASFFFPPAVAEAVALLVGCVVMEAAPTAGGGQPVSGPLGLGVQTIVPGPPVAVFRASMHWLAREEKNLDMDTSEGCRGSSQNRPLMRFLYEKDEVVSLTGRHLKALRER